MASSRMPATPATPTNGAWSTAAAGGKIACRPSGVAKTKGARNGENCSFGSRTDARFGMARLRNPLSSSARAWTNFTPMSPDDTTSVESTANARTA